MYKGKGEISYKPEANFVEKRWVHLGLIILLTFGVYANSLKNEFVYDDKFAIVDNNFIKNWKNFSKIFTKEYFSLAYEKSYRPICTFSFFIDYSLWKLNVFGWHLTNVSFHTANAILIYFLLSFIFSHSSNPAFGFRSSVFSVPLITALLFALHPVNSEAVDGISFREDLISFFFFLLAFLFYLMFIQKIKQRRNYLLYFASCISFIFALFSKEMAVTFPLSLVLYDCCFNKSKLQIKYRLYKYSGYFFITILYLLGRYSLFKPGGYLSHSELSSPLNYPWGSFFVTIFTMVKVFVYYIFLLFFPLRLSLDYVMRPSTSFFEWEVIVSVIFLMFILILSVKLYQYNHQEISFPIIYFFITLVPVSNIIPFGALMAERYLYFSALGFCILLGVCFVKNIVSSQTPLRNFWIFCLILLFIFYFLRTMKRNRDWKNDLTIWLKTVATSPNSVKAHYNLGISYFLKDLNHEAIAEFEKVLLIKSDHDNAHTYLGIISEKKGWYEKAIAHYKRALQIQPRNSIARSGLADSYYITGRYDEAINEYRENLNINPRDVKTHYNLGLAYLAKGKHKEALAHFEKIIEIKPNDPEVRKLYEEVIKFHERDLKK